jgi:hypothetical protein
MEELWTCPQQALLRYIVVHEVVYLLERHHRLFSEFMAESNVVSGITEQSACHSPTLVALGSRSVPT